MYFSLHEMKQTKRNLNYLGVKIFKARKVLKHILVLFIVLHIVISKKYRVYTPMIPRREYYRRFLRRKWSQSLSSPLIPACMEPSFS